MAYRRIKVMPVIWIDRWRLFQFGAESQKWKEKKCKLDQLIMDSCLQVPNPLELKNKCKIVDFLSKKTTP